MIKPRFTAHLSLQLALRLGIHARERQAPQNVNIDCHIDYSTSATPKSIDECYDYDALYHHITQTISLGPHIDLLENLLLDIVRFVFENSSATAVHVRASKTDAFEFARGAGVSIVVSKNEWIGLYA